MSADVNRAASVTPPVVGENLWVLAGTGSSRSIVVPDAWEGSYITMHADGDDFSFSFSLDAGATASITDDTAVAGSPLVFGAFGTETEKVEDGSRLALDLSMVRLKGRTLYLNVIATGTAGYLRITRSSGFVG